MQFINNGPDIPDALLQAHEEDRAVFFCGAGISYPAGLPSFRGLVDEIYQRLGTTCTDIENDAYRKGQFDITLDLLEHRIPGQRIAVRRKLVEALQPKLQRRGSTETHAALLQLARSREGTLRIVTTNFDRVFEHVARRSTQSYAAPTLPIPKESRWNGLVYLHGLLPSQPDESALHRLVVTSGDFGLAYLTERWAARFVSELFRNYVVCFVGYSINDPVLRYMMDALAADRMLGEETPQAYALGDYEPGQKPTQTNAWKSKGVLPILYEIRQGKEPHLALHQTLKVWAEIHRDGVFGREKIVVQHALARPSASTQQDDFVGRVLWALSDRSGLPAKRFANLNPAPPLEWLMAFSENRYGDGDMSRFGISPRPPIDHNRRFSLISRPAPYEHAPWMALVGSDHDTAWDPVMFQVARWLTRHLNDPALIHWLLENGCRIHDRLSVLIESELDRQDAFLREGRANELDKIRADSPHAIPDDQMRLIWRLLLRGRVRSSRGDHSLYGWMDHLKRDGLTASLRMQLREILSPMIVLRKPIRWPVEAVEPESSEQLRKVVDCTLVLSAKHVHSSIRDGAGEHWQRVLPTLLGDLQQLLLDALDLLRELGEADDWKDGSFTNLPSIEPHWQNRGFRDWVTLIELVRDSWLVIHQDDPEMATRIAERWFELPYPTFKRLAFFAASQRGCIDSVRWSDWLLSDACWWLWSFETRREVMRLLTRRGHCLSSSQLRLETAILDGPPHHMYPEGLAENIVQHQVWLFLAKLNASGLDLGDTARNRFSALSSANPSWQLLPHEREEFSYWMSGTGDPDYEENREINIAPRKRRELVGWLKAPPVQHFPDSADTWHDTCRTRFFHCLFALCDLAQEGVWPTVHWRKALQVWSEESQARRSRHYVAPLVCSMPDNVLLEVAHSVAWWLDATSKSVGRHEEILLGLCQRVLDLPLDSGSEIIQDGEPLRNPITEAINHPIGLVAQALLSLWFKREPNDNDYLPTDLEPLFRSMCDVRVERFRHGRVLLASRLIALFRVDRPWTDEHLLPLFRWNKNPVEAQVVWEGFLWSPRLHWPLLDAIRLQFIETVHHYDALSEHGRQQYAAVLTYSALEFTDKDAVIEFREVFRTLPQEGLREAARTLSQALETAGAQRKDYWTNRVRPFWQDMWPQSLDMVSADIAEPLALTIIEAEENFSDAVDLIHNWLKPLEHPDHVVYRLQKSGLCAKFPIAALRLLDAVIRDQPWRPSKLGQCLTVISQEKPDLRTDHRYRRLIEYAT